MSFAYIPQQPVQIIQTTILKQYSSTYAPPLYASQAFVPQTYVPNQFASPRPVIAQQVVPTQQFIQSPGPVYNQPYAQSVQGTSRVEYVPYERSVTEYEQQTQVIQVPRERFYTDYYAVEYQTEYIPQVYQEKYTEYQPVDRYVDRVQYYPVERQIVHQPEQQYIQPLPTQNYQNLVAPQYVQPIQPIQPISRVAPPPQYQPYRNLPSKRPVQPSQKKNEPTFWDKFFNSFK